MKKRSFKKSVIFTNFFLMVLLFVLLYIILSFTIRKSLLNSVGQLRFSEASLVANNIDNFIINNQRILRDISISIRELENNSENIQKGLNIFKPYLNNFDNGIFVFNSKGELMAEVPFIDKKRIGQSFAFREYFIITTSTKKPYVSKPYLSSKTNQYSIMFTFPVIEGEQIKFVVGGSINIQSLNNPIGALQNHKIGKSGYYYIYADDRSFIFHPDNSRIAKNDVPIGVNKLFDAALNGFEGFGETVNSKGYRYLATFFRIKSTNWILGGNYPINEALQPYEEMKKNIMVSFVFVFGFVLIGSFLVFKYFNRPFKHLSDAVSKIDIEKEGIKPIVIDGRFSYLEIDPVVDKINSLLDKIVLYQNRIVEVAQNEAISLIAGGVFHDITNSLTAANTRLYLLKKYKDNDPNAEKILSELEDILNNITGLSRKLLELSYTSAGNKKLVNIRELIKGVIKICDCSKYAVKIETESAVEPWLVYGDEIALLQVFQNILLNAVQATTDKSRAIEVRISNFDNKMAILAEIPQKRYVKISIKNYGEEIKEENLKKIFEPYFTTKPGGYGIGLTVAKKIIIEHEGYIFVNSSREEGTEFIIYLPYYAEKTLEEAKSIKN
ncbi:sensor histidine kinase [Calditerrivibrio nitroreducens]|uniref:histidine kinase n=1 Tax=Calditerrivibrio nitroreducens (strain DSM 19672 / NBRC 101217 / Yu37-1) TaxID=768670 RepID=E4TH36_CALNY|nr:sensor histidine kinase [Calditerrivibrio nitroreducens]ADR19834.1 integral membrane sensor signal transduction histidine kinase [Calditerrivibrio nitroreducens DSM 19672]